MKTITSVEKYWAVAEVSTYGLKIPVFKVEPMTEFVNKINSSYVLEDSVRSYISSVVHELLGNDSYRSINDEPDNVTLTEYLYMNIRRKGENRSERCSEILKTVY